MSNVSVETLEKLKDSMVGIRYKHFKGRTYIVTDIAVHTESDAGFVEGWNQCIDEIAGGNADD